MNNKLSMREVAELRGRFIAVVGLSLAVVGCASVSPKAAPRPEADAPVSSGPTTSTSRPSATVSGLDKVVESSSSLPAASLASSDFPRVSIEIDGGRISPASVTKYGADQPQFGFANTVTMFHDLQGRRIKVVLFSSLNDTPETKFDPAEIQKTLDSTTVDPAVDLGDGWASATVPPIRSVALNIISSDVPEDSAAYFKQLLVWMRPASERLFHDGFVFAPESGLKQYFSAETGSAAVGLGESSFSPFDTPYGTIELRISRIVDSQKTIEQFAESMYLPIVRWGDFEVIYDKKSHYSPGSVSWIQNGFVVYVQGFLDEGQLKSIVASVRLDDK